MNIERPKLEVKIGDAVLLFKEMKNNKRQRFVYILKRSDSKDVPVEEQNANETEYRALVLSHCVSVENLLEDGEPVTLEKIQAEDLYSETLNSIFHGYIIALAGGKKAPEADAKNDAGGSESQTA